jgi:hypothetical protein
MAMDTAALLANLPEGGKVLQPFILRAQEMATRDPAVSYWCKC